MLKARFDNNKNTINVSKRSLHPYVYQICFSYTVLFSSFEPPWDRRTTRRTNENSNAA